MAYATLEARQQLLDTLAEATDELAFALACLTEAYDKLDEYNGDRLEEAVFRPVQVAFGRAKRTHAEFAERHRLTGRTFDEPSPGVASNGAPGSSTARSRRSTWPTRRWRPSRTRCCRSRRATRACGPDSRRCETVFAECRNRPASCFGHWAVKAGRTAADHLGWLHGCGALQGHGGPSLFSLHEAGNPPAASFRRAA